MAMDKGGDICPACGAEFESGTFKRCGGSIVNEFGSLRAKISELESALEAAEHALKEGDQYNKAEALSQIAQLKKGKE